MENHQKSDQEIYLETKKAVRAMRSFYYNLTCYVIVISMLAFVNLYYMPQKIWFVYSAFGWGIGLFFHWMGAFKPDIIWGRKWEERKIRELLEKENNTKNK